MLVKILKWPVISFLTVSLVLLVTKIFFPELTNMFNPSIMSPVWLAFGIWIGYKTVQHGGDFRKVYAAGAFFGILPTILYVLDFGFLLGKDVSAGLLGGVFSFSMVIFGVVIGGGFGLSDT